MATPLDPISLDPVPARVITPERRTRRIIIETPVGEEPRFEVVREIIARDDQGAVVPGYTEEGYLLIATLSQLMTEVPEHASIAVSIAQAIDLLDARRRAV